MAASIWRGVLDRERGPPFTPGGRRLALVYPATYAVGMASLGYQHVLGLLRAAGLSAERAFVAAGRDPDRRLVAPVSCETGTPLARFPLIAVSIAWELELGPLVELLERAGIPPLRADRGPHHPLVLAGGPLTSSNPLPLSPIVDALILGEADHTVVPAVEAFFEPDTDWLDAIRALPGGHVPADGGPLPPLARSPDEELPACSLILTPDSALPGMFLVEGARGCSRSCAFCVMQRSACGGMRVVSPERVLARVPDHAPKVGLVGAAITDHPQLVEILEELVADGRGIGVSSLRADRIAARPRLAELLRTSGARTLTVAVDGPSERLRRSISKGLDADHLRACSQLAREHGYDRLKVYAMVGLPGEEDEDLDELIDLSVELSRAGRVVLAVSPFVAKRHTPLDGAPFAGIKVVERRLKRLRRGLKGRVELRPVSARWAWVEHVLSQAGREAGEAVVQAVRAGGRFADYRRALHHGDSQARRAR